MNKPIFEINENILNLVAEIYNKLGKLEVTIDRRKDFRLRETSKVRSVNSSCAIEANTLSEEEVMSVINGKRVVAPLKEIIEVQNAYNAYLHIEDYTEYEVSSLLQAHKYLTENLKDDAGQFRYGDVAVYDDTKVLHLGARPQFINTLIEDLFSWAKNSDINPLIKACAIHYEIEFIHPFSDGNGRVGRLWQSVILYNCNPLFELIPIETLVYENQQTYYHVISLSNEYNNCTLFIEFMLNMILKTMESFEERNISNFIKAEFLNNLSKTEKEVLNNIYSYFKNNDFLVIEDAVRMTGKKEAILRRYLRKYVSSDILIAIGVNKGRKYKLNNAILVKE